MEMGFKCANKPINHVAIVDPNSFDLIEKHVFFVVLIIIFDCRI